MGAAQYLIRLDDLCHTSNLKNWERFFDLFDKYNIKPIIAAIPANKDPKLLACSNHNDRYWDYVRKLHKKGYKIALHGYEHLYVNDNSGILKINQRSEFAGLPLHDQEYKVAKGYTIFKRHKIPVNIFIAPAHAFDKNTLVALSKHTPVNIISDGLLSHPYTRYGFKWIPAQLPEAESKQHGTWTFNYHPETCTIQKFRMLEYFMETHHQQFISFEQLTFEPFTLKDNIAEKAIICTNFLRSKLRSLFLL